MLSKIRIFADEYDMFPDKGAVLACVSGGADSMCLLDALLEISPERGFTVSVAHFNHELRGEESDLDEEFVREQCAVRGTPFYSARGNARAYAKEHKLGVEAAARDLRYGFFYSAASDAGAGRIATAHTADDNAETVILNLARGAGASGLSGIPPVRGMIIRPMLRVSRADVMLYIKQRDIPYREDSSNALEVFTRNRLRRSVIPVLRGINPRFSEAASSAAELIRADEEYLSGLADNYITEHSVINPRTALIPRPLTPGSTGLSADGLSKLPFAVSSRVVRKLCGGNPGYRHVKEILAMCARGGRPASISLPGMTVYVEYGRVIFGRDVSLEGFAPVYLNDGDCATIPGPGLRITCKSVVFNESIRNANTPFPGENEAVRAPLNRINKSFTSFLFKKADIYGKMTVRSRREGDFIRFIGRDGTKSLKKLFIELRIPARERACVPVIADDAGVLAVYGLGTGDRAAPQPGDPAFQIDFEEI